MIVVLGLLVWGDDVDERCLDYDDWNGQLDIEVYTDGWQFLAGGSVGVNTMGNLIPFNTTSLKACATPYNLTCKATINGQEFWTNSTLSYLPPNPYGGNVVKVDRTSGALIVKNDTGNGEWDKIIPFGWYDVSVVIVRDQIETDEE